MKKFTTTIRMGASAWDVKMASSEGELHFDLRSMNRDDRRTFHNTFVEAVGGTLKNKGHGKKKHRRSRQRASSGGRRGHVPAHQHGPARVPSTDGPGVGSRSSIPADV